MARNRTGAPWEAVERDYLLSWILAGLQQVDSLQDTLVFKGGTALKKCYFGDYRFSEDLDFSALEAAPTGKALERAIQAACEASIRLLDEFVPVQIAWQRYTEREPHPTGQEAFVIRAQFPWHRQPHARALVEISVDEQVLTTPVRRALIHEYGEPLDATVLVYSLEEVVAEKLRSILQHMRKMEERGWARSRARDYYDLWRVLGEYRSNIDISNFRELLNAKCALKGVTFSGSEDFFRSPMIDYVEKTWEQWLGPLVPALPSFQTIADDLKPRIRELLAENR
jgi:predicted nucleotidyltransferase component of viral defense system